jgi:hypothetical protein
MKERSARTAQGNNNRDQAVRRLRTPKRKWPPPVNVLNLSAVRPFAPFSNASSLRTGRNKKKTELWVTGERAKQTQEIVN